MNKHWNILTENNTNNARIKLDGKIFYDALQLSKYYNISKGAGELIYENLFNQSKQSLLEELKEFKSLLDDTKSINIIEECEKTLSIIKEVKIHRSAKILNEEANEFLLGNSSWDKENEKVKTQIKNIAQNEPFAPFEVLQDTITNNILKQNNADLEELLKTTYVIGLSFTAKYQKFMKFMAGNIANNRKLNPLNKKTFNNAMLATDFFTKKKWNVSSILQQKEGYVIIISKGKPANKINNAIDKKQTTVTQMLLKAGFNAEQIKDKSNLVNDNVWATLPARDIFNRVASYINPNYSRNLQRQQQQNIPNNQNQPQNPNQIKETQVVNAVRKMGYDQQKVIALLRTLTPQQWQQDYAQLVQFVMKNYK